MFDFLICDRSPISVQRIMDKKFDEDVDLHGTYLKKIGFAIANAALPARMPGLSLA